MADDTTGELSRKQSILNRDTDVEVLWDNKHELN